MDNWQSESSETSEMQLNLNRLFDEDLSDHFASDQVHEADPAPNRPSAAQRPARAAPPAPTQEQVFAEMAGSSQGRPASGSSQQKWCAGKEQSQPWKKALETQWQCNGKCYLSVQLIR